MGRLPEEEIDALVIAEADNDAAWKAPTRINPVPVISMFFGIVIRMFYQEHGVPHFHAEYQGQQATFTFDGRLLAGTIRSRTAMRLIADWARAHRQELETNWEHARDGRPLERIAPLD